jgi:cyclophilin family peptidyl-prolyl cis-trans isomerase
VRTLSWTALAFLLVLSCKNAPAGSGPAAAGSGKASAPAGTRVVLETSHGEIEIELFADKAPIGVRNFLHYVESGGYDGTIFHRVIPRFVVQGGGFDAELRKRPTAAPIQNEAKNGLRNQRGTVAWARTPNPHSATNQFFINLKDNTQLDQEQSPTGWGYAVFGRVVRGMEVAEKIASIPTAPRGDHPNVPVEPAGINRARVK